MLNDRLFLIPNFNQRATADTFFSRFLIIIIDVRLTRKIILCNCEMINHGIHVAID